MKAHLSVKRYHFFLYLGLPSIFLAVGIVTVLCLITPSLNDEEAKRRIRLSLKRELSQKHMTILKKSGKKVPDHQTAIQWQEEIRKINSLRVSSVIIKRPLPDIVLAFDRPTYVAQVTFLDEEQHQNIRYFWLSWAGVDREISKWIWYFSY